jgi:hypothetical protein
LKLVEIIEDEDGFEKVAENEEDANPTSDNNDFFGDKTPDHSPNKKIRFLQLERDASELRIERDVARQERDTFQQQVIDLKMSNEQHIDSETSSQLRCIQ